jgi:hypothetical protein
MQFPGQGRPPLGVVFDSDLGDRIDAALALAALYTLDGKSELRVISLSVSRPDLKSAAFCEVLARFYNPGGRMLPVGMATGGAPAGTPPMLSVPLGRRNAAGAPVYQHGIAQLNDTADPLALIRNAFTAQQDQNGVMVVAGRMTNLAGVVALPGALEIIARKARLLVVGGPRPLARDDAAALGKVLAVWPTPVVVADFGDTLRYPAAGIEKDFAWAADHPLLDAWRTATPNDAPAGDAAAALYAVRPQAEFWKLSVPGTITLRDDGAPSLAPGAGGKHRLLHVDPAQREKLLGVLAELISAKPVPRQSRFRP